MAIVPRDAPARLPVVNRTYTTIQVLDPRGPASVWEVLDVEDDDFDGSVALGEAMLDEKVRENPAFLDCYMSSRVPAMLKQKDSRASTPKVRVRSVSQRRWSRESGSHSCSDDYSHEVRVRRSGKDVGLPMKGPVVSLTF